MLTREHSDRVLRLIAVFRFGKAALLFAAGLVALKFIRPSSRVDLHRWLDALPLAAQQEFMQRLIAKVMRLPAHTVGLGIVVLFLYASLYTAETIGLWFRKKWGEWLTIIATSSFIPFEIYEVARGMP